MQIITSTGFGDSGSSAITDLISEYSGIKAYSSEWEFSFLHTPDGLGDLENAIIEGHRLKCDFAIQRFLQLTKFLNKEIMYKTAFKNQFYTLSVEFIESLCSIKWNGMYEDKINLFLKNQSKKEKLFIKLAETNYKINKNRQFEMYESDSWRPSYIPCVDTYYSNDINNFYICVKNYIHKLMELAADGEQRLFLDQLLPPINYTKYLKYFTDDIKLFIVDKDPRDLFLVENLFNGSRFVPFENVTTFIEWYKSTRVKSITEINAKVISCKLNEIIYEYDEFCKRVESFLNISPDKHISKKTKFIPNKSATNVNLYLKYDNYENEVKIIENQLQDFIYKENIQNSNSVKHCDFPVVELIHECNNIQEGKITHNKANLIISSTFFLSNIYRFNKLRSKSKKIKCLIKIAIGFFIFIPEVIYTTIKLR